MLIYYLIIIICIELYWLIYVTNKKNILNDSNLYLENKVNFRNKFYFIIVSVLMIITIGLRNINIGIDTINYYNSFNSYKNISFNMLNFNTIEEPGYVFLQILLNKIGINFQMFLIIMAILYIGIVTYYIYKYSDSPWFSYLMFIAFGYFTFSMSTIRQTIAITILMIGFLFALKKKFIPFFILTIIASTIHITAICFLPAYFAQEFRVNRKSIISFILLGIILIILKEPIRVLINSYARQSYDSISTGGNLMYIFMLGSIIVGVAFTNLLYENHNKNTPFLYMMTISTLIFPLTQFHPAVIRLHFYFSIFMIIYVPNMLKSVTDKYIKTLGYLCYTLVMVYMFVINNNYKEFMLSPYMFFWQ